MATSKSTSSAARKKSGSTKKSSNSDVAKGLHDLFENELKDIYWAEKALVKALPKMIKKASSEELVEALEKHLEETEQQVVRLEEVFAAIGVKAEAKKCEAMVGLISEAEDVMKETEPGVVCDAGIIASAQKVEHYEIATYGTLCAFAKTLGEDDALELLEETLNEEKEADVTLTQIAESSINVEAADEDMEEESSSRGKSL